MTDRRHQHVIEVIGKYLEDGPSPFPSPAVIISHAATIVMNWPEGSNVYTARWVEDGTHTTDIWAEIIDEIP